MTKRNLQSVAQRDGAIVPLFAFLIPVLLIMSAFAVNLAHHQLAATQLRCATDVASFAGGRALNVYQQMDDPTADRVITRLQDTVNRYYVANSIDGKNLEVPGNFSDYIRFYNLGTGHDRIDKDYYNEDNEVSEAEARDGTNFNGVAVYANIEAPSVFNVNGMATKGESESTFRPERLSVTRQIERDLAIVIDKSGSMLEYSNKIEMDSVLDDMRNQGYLPNSVRLIAKGFSKAQATGNGVKYFERPRDTASVYNQRFQISFNHYRYYNDQYNYVSGFDVIAALRNFRDANPGDSRDLDAMIAYMVSWEETGNRKNPFVTDNWIASGMFNDHAPEESKWDYLYRGLQDFVEVLEHTPAEEKISLVVFDINADAKHSLTSDYDAILDEVAAIIPNSGTSIHDGMDVGLTKVLEPGVTRPFAEKIIVVMTDGENTFEQYRDEPINAARRAKSENPEITIHTLTFGYGTGITESNDPETGLAVYEGVMVDVAEVGSGEHFHAKEAEELRKKLIVIANIQPTVYTF